MHEPRVFNLGTRRAENRSRVRHQRADTYLFITLLSFAASITVTRFFLYITGYPQIGGGELHIAHVLWGGLLLFAACLILLIYANTWAYYVGSVLSGIGVGLFIDEVGKFITQNNDYFYPSAAPIIYAFFLLTLLVFSRVRRRGQPDARTYLYYVLENLEELADRDLSREERKKIIDHLEEILEKNPDRDLKRLAELLHTFISSEVVHLVPHRPGPWDKLKARLLKFEQTWMTRSRYRAFLSAGLAALAIWALFFPLAVIFSIHDPHDLQILLSQLVHDRLVRNASGLNWFEARVGMEGSLGILFLASAVLMVIRKEKLSLKIASVALTLSLSVANLLLFYFDQFSTISNALVQFALLIGILRYRKHYKLE